MNRESVKARLFSLGQEVLNVLFAHQNLLILQELGYVLSVVVRDHIELFLEFPEIYVSR